MYNRKSDKTKLTDKDYEFCTRCNSKEVANKIITICTDDGSTTEARLCVDCIKDEYPTIEPCICCGTTENVTRTLCVEIETSDKVVVPVCCNCVATLEDSSMYEIIEG